MNLETLRLLVAKGLSAEDILEVAETMDAPAAVPVRSAGAIRQARYRTRLAAEGNACDVTDDVTRDVTGDGNEGDGTSLPRLPNENKSNPSTPTHPEEKSRASDAGTHEATGTDPVGADAAAGGETAGDGEVRKPKRAVAVPTALPDGWEPVLTPAAQQIVDGWPPGMLDRERMAFEAHAASNDRVTKDWQAAFRTWIAKADRNRIERNGNRSTAAGRGFANGHQPDRRDGFTRSLDDTIARGRPGGAPLQ